jgi:hypothetical protein
MDSEMLLRRHLVRLLDGRGAHAPFGEAVRGLAPRLRGVRPDGLVHSPWEILEHLRIAQWDIFEFSRNPKHVSPRWPEGYWPKKPAPPNPSAWTRSVRAFRSDLAAMKKRVASRKLDLFTPFAHGDGQTLLREALVLADHNAYHVGELVAVRRALGAWPPA